MSARKAERAMGERLPPHAAEAEAGVLGCVLAGGAEMLDLCEERGVGRDWFYDLRHQLVWAAMAALQKAGADVDTITVLQRLKEQEPGTDTDWVELLARLQDGVPSAANLPSYLDICEDKRLERALVATGTGMVSGVYAVEDGQKIPVRELVAQAEREVLRLSELGSAEGEEQLKTALGRVLDRLEDYHRGGPQMHGLLSTGLGCVEKLLGGLGGEHGNYIVISARPGIGKTSLAMQIALHAALDHVWWEPVLENGQPATYRTEAGEERVKCEERRGVPVGVFSLEMATTALVERMLFQRAGGNIRNWRTGFATEADFKALGRASAEINKAPVWIDDEPRRTVESFRAAARRLARRHGLKLLVLDYIQLMRAGGRRFREDRVQELSEISGEIQALGKELEIPIIVLAQMNRDYEKDPNRTPRLSDLKDCGSIEQDADLVGFLHHPKLKDDDRAHSAAVLERYYSKDWSDTAERVRLMVCKNRYGPTGHCDLLFERRCTRFLDWYHFLKDKGEKELSTGDRGYHKPLTEEDED